MDSLNVNLTEIFLITVFFNFNLEEGKVTLFNVQSNDNNQQTRFKFEKLFVKKIKNWNILELIYFRWDTLDLIKTAPIIFYNKKIKLKITFSYFLIIYIFLQNYNDNRKERGFTRRRRKKFQFETWMRIHQIINLFIFFNKKL